MAGDPKKIRTEFRKNRSQRARRADWTRAFTQDQHDDESAHDERVGKDDSTRKRTVRGVAVEDAAGKGIQREVDEALCLRGRVLLIHGLASHVAGDDGIVYRCAVRRVLKTMSTDQRHVVAVGDHVLFKPIERSDPPEGFIERVEPRHGCICREIRGRQQVLVANVDQVIIVASVGEPPLKANLVDRLLVSAEKGRVQPLVCINKIDLVDPAELQPLVGVYSQMGLNVYLCSAETGQGIERLRRVLAGRESVLAGQSGVGKSSLLNAIDPTLQLRVGKVCEETLKGRHTTSSARLLPLASGGFVVDTPGVRQFLLWDVVPREVAAYFRDLRPYVSLCRFPDCTHTHEDDCAVKSAVADGRLDERRYESYCHMIEEEEGHA